MDQNQLVEGLIEFLAFIAFVTLHEYAHAAVADRCGDDTPRRQGRLTFDPIAHIDPIGTLLLPLVLIVSSASQGHVFFFGWGRPVQVNPNNFNVRRRDDIMVAAAGPFMNLVIAVGMLGLMRAGTWAGFSVFEDNTLFHLVQFSLFLCFFNLLPIPPLDGGHIMRNFINMSDEAYAQLTQYSFIFFIIIMQVPAISGTVSLAASHTAILLGRLFGWHLVLH